PPGAQTLEDKVKTFTLANGMQFVVVERPVAPVFFGAVGFNVGSINEWDGQTGISHLLEHMLFKGTRKIGTLSYAKEKRYLDKEDALAIGIANMRRDIGHWRVAIYDDYVRNLASSLPESERQKIGSDKIKEMAAVIGILEAKQQMPEEAKRYPTLIEERGINYYDKYVETKRKQLELAKVQEEHRKIIVKDEFWDTYVQNGGRMLNAFTADDETAYFVYLPSNRLELWMAMESDRLRDPIFREIYQERDVVSEERRLGENDPEDELWNALTAAAFEASPYRRPVVGWMSDIQNINRPELQAYFHRYYAPNNAVAILIGDVDVKNAQRLATRYFGNIPRQPAIPPVVTQEPAQKGERRVVVEHTANPRVLIGYHVPTAPHPDSYPVNALIQILGSGRTSRLYKKIYEELQLTASPPEVSSGPGEKLDNLLIIDATPRYPHTTDEVEQAIYKEIEAIKTQPPTDRELQRIRNQVDAQMVRTLGSNLGIAFNLGLTAVTRGDWHAYLDDIDKLKQVKPEDVSYVAKQYLTPENRTVATIVKVEEKQEGSAKPEQVDMKALMNYVRSLPEAEQHELFQKFQSASPEERKAMGVELMKRMKADQEKSGQKPKEDQGGK
ncbi:MAG TPA: pitrilysin family protein, partial [bacterium]|nr:pitrilysin family protein [bacterium]